MAAEKVAAGEGARLSQGSRDPRADIGPMKGIGFAVAASRYLRASPRLRPPLGSRRRPGARHDLRRLPGRQRVAPGRLGAARPSRRTTSGRGDRTPRHATCTPTSVRRSYGIPYDVVGAGHANVVGRLHLRERERPRPVSVRPDITVEGGSDRHALMIDESDCTLYELFAQVERREPDGAASGAIFDLGSNDLRPARLDERRRGGAADLRRPRSGPTRCRPGEVDHAIRFTVGCTARSVPVARAAPGRVVATGVPADGRAVPAEAGLPARGVQRRREGDPARR